MPSLSTFQKMIPQCLKGIRNRKKNHAGALYAERTSERKKSVVQMEPSSSTLQWSRTSMHMRIERGRNFSLSKSIRSSDLRRLWQCKAVSNLEAAKRATGAYLRLPPTGIANLRAVHDVRSVQNEGSSTDFYVQSMSYSRVCRFVSCQGRHRKAVV